ncbi:hypothetical protein GCM10009099_33120 [Caenispirillum bisanense]
MEPVAAMVMATSDIRPMTSSILVPIRRRANRDMVVSPVRAARWRRRHKARQQGRLDGLRR